MCGIPYHASKLYIARLLRLGKKIAVCEQIGLPGGKGLTERRVTEIITPGTAVEEEYLEQGTHNFLAALTVTGKTPRTAALAYIDVSTGDFLATSWEAANMAEDFSRELGRANPRELLLPESLKNDGAIREVLDAWPGLSVSWHPDWLFSPEIGAKKMASLFRTANLRSFALTGESPEVCPAGFLLDYLSKNTNSSLPHVTGITVYHHRDYLLIDEASRRNLEIQTNIRDGSRAFTLLETLDHTKTPLGKRLLRNWLAFPLTDVDKINARQDAVRGFTNSNRRRDSVRDLLGGICDLERLAGRIAMERVHPKDLQALRHSLESWKEARKILADINPVSLGTDFKAGEEIITLIGEAILDDPSTSLTEGNIIRVGWSEKLDRLHRLKNNSSEILAAYIQEERQKTGIQTLKLRQNRMIGYYIEVSKGKIPRVPDHFALRRTLVNADCYSTRRLGEIESELNSAEEQIIDEERRLFVEVREKIKAHLHFLFAAAYEIAHTDVTTTLAHVAVLHSYTCPLVDQSGTFRITAGRHPVVERHLPPGEFVPNDMSFEGGKTLALITGPNMAGKSTYLRQNALITVMAQIGSFVPAAEAHLGVVDRIFCRVGASDNIARGESTFLVEMTETALILRSATPRSLVIMDEVGRGTSTEDGLSIAWAVCEHLLEALTCKTLFATHYHELTRLSHNNLHLLCLEVLEQDGTVVFLKKIHPGASANSYGIHVARLAGIPDSVITRARDLLARFQTLAGDPDPGTVPDAPQSAPVGLSIAKPGLPGLFNEEELVLDEILSFKPEAMTPLEALQKITRWHRDLSGL
jgi:DNA mismatch repair protein MutS